MIFTTPLILKDAFHFLPVCRAGFVGCDLCRCTEASAEKGSTLGLWPCCCHLEIFNFLTKDSAFSFCTGPQNLCNWSCLFVSLVFSHCIFLKYSSLKDALRRKKKTNPPFTLYCEEMILNKMKPKFRALYDT